LERKADNSIMRSQFVPMSFSHYSANAPIPALRRCWTPEKAQIRPVLIVSGRGHGRIVNLPHHQARGRL
jgi:hypothetical protein